jgi:general stress protein YciG
VSTRPAPQPPLPASARSTGEAAPNATPEPDRAPRAKRGKKPSRADIILAVRMIEEYLGGVHTAPKEDDPEPPITVAEAGRRGGASRARKLRRTPEGRARLREIARLGGEAARGKSGRPRKRPPEE